jgi:large subunit ribosomal protein L35
VRDTILQECIQAMPKLKTHRGAAKRFKKTATGKFVSNSAFKRHLASSKTTKRMRHLGKASVASPADSATLERMLPYK